MQVKVRENLFFDLYVTSWIFYNLLHYLDIKQLEACRRYFR